MLRSSLLVVLLGLSGCGGPDTEDTAVGPVEPANIPAEPAAESVEAPPPTEPLPQSPSIPVAENDGETALPEPTPPPSKREIVRMRCKPNYTTCYGGRECCNDLLEVCGKDNHCHPLE
jgi:hypothetical protein